MKGLPSSGMSCHPKRPSHIRAGGLATGRVPAPYLDPRRRRHQASWQRSRSPERAVHVTAPPREAVFQWTPPAQWRPIESNATSARYLFFPSWPKGSQRSRKRDGTTTISIARLTQGVPWLYVPLSQGICLSCAADDSRVIAHVNARAARTRQSGRSSEVEPPN
jgi:hypothetical protein